MIIYIADNVNTPLQGVCVEMQQNTRPIWRYVSRQVYILSKFISRCSYDQIISCLEK